MRHQNRMSRGAVAVVLLGLAGVFGGVTGCVGSAASPGVTDDRREAMLPFPAVAENIIAAVRWVTNRHPIEGPYALNLPSSLTESECQEIVRRLKDPNARLLTEETKTLPIIHIESVRIVGDMATVQVHRPITPAGGPAPAGEGAVTQAMEVQLRGGVQPWRVTAVRPWMLGAQVPPRLKILGGPPTPPPRPTYESSN